MNIDFKKLREEVEKIEKAGEIEQLLVHDTCYNRFKETALEMPDAIAMNYFGNKITYRQMITLVDELAAGFYSIGVRKDDAVTMSMLSTPYGIASFYALDKIGALMHMVNGTGKIEEVTREISKVPSKFYVANDLFCNEQIQEVLKEYGVEKFVLTSLVDGMPMGFNVDKSKYKLIEQLKGLKQKDYNKNVLSFDQIIDLGNENKITVIPCQYEKDHNATIAYTSGSTGDAKGCVGTWDGIDSMVQVMAMTEQGRFETGDVMLTTFPLWIYYSLLNMIHEPLCLGVTLALDPLFDPKNLAKRNKQYEFNHWLTIPTYMKKAVSLKDTDCSKWKIVLTGGDALTNEVKESADKFIKRNNGTAEVVQGYGASECLGSFAYCYYPNSTIGSVGKSCIGNMIKILDIDTLEEVKQGETGIGYFYSPALMKEYYKDEEATNHNLVKDENGAIWYNTEDLIHQNEKGEIFLDGRLRRIALTLDENGNPAKIIPERTKKELSKLEMIDKCEVITVPDEEIENKAVAYVVVKEGIEKNEMLKENMKDYCKISVPDYMAPKEVIFIDEMPLTPSKKNDIQALTDMYKNKDLNQVTNKKKNLKQLLKSRK